MVLMGVLCWALIHITRHYHHPIPILNDYLTDVLAVPVIAQICLWITRRFIVRDAAYVYPRWYFLFIAAYLSIVFEVIMPHLSPAYTADIGDVGAYFVGAALCMYRTPNRAATTGEN